MLFKCIRKCHGFKRRLWEEGQTVEVGPNEEQPPKHFVLIDAPEPMKVIEPEKPMALSEMEKPPIPKTGMGAGLDHTPPEKPETLKRRRKK